MMSANCAAKAALVLETINDYQIWRKELKGSLALVPTMGALHAGHLSLIRKAKTLADNVLVYIFVNPMQFGPKEDFGTYPRTPDKDIELCEKENVDAIFMPGMVEIYPDGKDNCTKVVPPSELADILEGHFRPGFFTGVATVLVKFFSITQPDIVIFGEKDYQQLLIVRRFVQDLNLPIAVHGAPIVRESDGLALSSRNLYLNKEQRAQAPRIQALLQEAAANIKANRLNESKKIEEIEKILEPVREKFKAENFDLQYLEARDGGNLQALSSQSQKIVLLLAAKINNIRLIDNLVV